MRILYFSRSYTTHDRRFLAALAHSQHEICYLRLENDAVCYETRPVPGNVRVLPPLAGGDFSQQPESWVRLVPRLQAVLQQVKPDVVHAGPVQRCAFLAALTGFRPLIAMSWGSDILVEAQQDNFWKWMTRYALDHADLLISDCGEVSDEAHKIADFDRRKILQFPWGVDTGTFRPPATEDFDRLGLRQRSGWEHGRIVISTRSWEPIYGVLHLVEGFRLALEREPRLRLVLAGDGSQAGEIRRRIQQAGMEHAVWLPGAVPQDQVADYFRAADVYASFAYSDGSSLSLLEAMATGLPVIATDRASNREWISDGWNGRLVRFENTAAMGEAMVELATLPPGRRRDMAARNRGVVEERADWTHNTARLFEAYENVNQRCPMDLMAMEDQRIHLCPLSVS